MLKFIFALLFVMLSGYTYAGDLVLTFHLTSVHDKQGFNNDNPGLGIRSSDENGEGFGVGSYYNSECKTTVYVGYEFNKQLTQNISVGLFVGGATGYSKNVIPFVLPSIAYSISKDIDGRLSYGAKVNPDGAQVIHLSIEYKF